MVKAALTDAGIRRLKPPETGQIDIFDSGYPGFALRVSYGGRKAFVFFYRYGDRVHRMSLGTYPAIGLAEAREAWRAARTEVQRGRDPGKIRRRETPATNFASVAQEWLKRDQEGNRTASEARRIIDKYVMPHWGGLRIDDIGRRDVLDLTDGIVDRGTPVMARRVHARLQRMFNWAVARGIIAASPMHGLPKPASETSRDRVLTDEEIVDVWRGAEGIGFPFGTVVRLLLLTGARREEIGGLRWLEVHADTIELEGTRTKTAQPRTIPLPAPAALLLGGTPRIGEGLFVFSTNGHTPISGWSRAKRRLDVRAPIAPWHLHDLRRTVATGMQKLGVGLQVIEAVLGHVSGSRAGVVGIYQRHTYDAEKRAALEAWGAHVMALVEGSKPGKVLPMRGKV